MLCQSKCKKHVDCSKPSKICSQKPCLFPLAATDLVKKVFTNQSCKFWEDLVLPGTHAVILAVEGLLHSDKAILHFLHLIDGRFCDTVQLVYLAQHALIPMVVSEQSLPVRVPSKRKKHKIFSGIFTQLFTSAKWQF